MYTNLVIALAAFATQVEAFWGTGHLLVSRHAQAILEDQYPDVLQSALNEMEPLQKYYSSLTTNENNNPFTECATEGDDWKGKGYSFQSDWHFINLPYYDEAGTSEADFPDFDQGDVDVVQAMTDITGFLKGTISASESTYLQQIAEKFSYEEDQRSFAIRLLIHYVGDVHQPEHATALVDSKYPHGDEGGNYEHIPSQDGVGNLHYVWDSVIYEFTGYPTLPFSDDDFSWYTSTASTLSDANPLSSSDLKSCNFNGWAQESFDIAKTYVYPNFEDGQIPDQDYQDQAKPIIERQLVLGGARLADLMVSIYGNTRINKTNVTEFLN